MKTLRTWFARERSPKVRDDAARRKAIRARRLSLDSLEDRRMLSTTAPAAAPSSSAPAPASIVLTVIDDVDIPNPGTPAQWAIYNGSLRGILNQANAEPAGTTVTIDFNSDGGGFDEFQPVSPLPVITHPVTIDGTTQPLLKGGTATGTGPNVQIDGTYAGNTNGLTFSASASGSVLKGVEVTDFQGDGIVLAGTSNVTLANDIVGLQVTAGPGYQKIVTGPNAVGVLIGSGSGNTLNDVTVSANNLDGIQLFNTVNNTIENSFVGTDPAGEQATAFNPGPNGQPASLGNGAWDHYGTGIFIHSGSSNNTITNTVISNNGTYGVLLSDPGTNSNTLTDNHIGTDASGYNAMGNVTTGVMIQNGASYNNIGSWASGSGNVISGNGWDGIDVTGSGTTENQVLQNLIGTSQSSTWAIGNWNGVVIQGGASLTNLYLNTIAGNHSDGVYITDSNTWGNSLEDNYIGIDAYGYAVNNGANGVVLVFGTYDNTIYANTIEYSDGVGLYTYQASSNTFLYNNVINNYQGNISMN